jgi:hypothetical protein
MACCKCCCEAGDSPGVCCSGVCCRSPNECLTSGNITRCCEPYSTLCGNYCCPGDRSCCSDICCPADSSCCADSNGNQICCPAGQCVEGVCQSYCQNLYTGLKVTAMGHSVWATLPVSEYPDKPGIVTWRGARNPACDDFVSPPADGLAGYSLCFARIDNTGVNCTTPSLGGGTCTESQRPSGMEGACCATVRLIYHCADKGYCNALFEVHIAQVWVKGSTIVVTQPATPSGCPDVQMTASLENIGTPPGNPLP